MGGKEEGFASTYLCDKSDPTRLSWREIHDGWGSCHNFMTSYGLKAGNPDHGERALDISREMKAYDNQQKK